MASKRTEKKPTPKKVVKVMKAKVAKTATIKTSSRHPRARVAEAFGGKAKLAKTLAGHGLEVIVPDGQVFDPALHEAVMTEPAATPEEDHTVARTFQVGYVFNGQLLRPARVVVKQWNG